MKVMWLARVKKKGVERVKKGVFSSIMIEIGLDYILNPVGICYLQTAFLLFCGVF